MDPADFEYFNGVREDKQVSERTCFLVLRCLRHASTRLQRWVDEDDCLVAARLVAEDTTSFQGNIKKRNVIFESFSLLEKFLIKKKKRKFSELKMKS